MSEKTKKTGRGAPAGKVHASFYLPEEMRKQLKLRAIDEGRPVTEIVEEFIATGLKKPPKREA